MREKENHMKWQYFHIKQTAFQENVYTHVPPIHLVLQGLGLCISGFAYKAPSGLSCKLGSNNTWQGVSLHPLWPNKNSEVCWGDETGLNFTPEVQLALGWSLLPLNKTKTTQLSSECLTQEAGRPQVVLKQPSPPYIKGDPSSFWKTGPLGFCLPSSAAVYINVTDTAVQVCSAYPILQYANKRLSVCRSITP